MIVSVNNPQALYQFFYLFAFIFMFSVVLYKSIRRGYNLRFVLLMLTTITLFTIIGTRLFTISMGDWLAALHTKSSEFNNRSSIGGLLFGLMALLSSQQIFGFKRSMVDLFAWVVPITLGITKLGCLFSGCCYGLPFNGFCAIQYPKGTQGHFNHWLMGSIENDALFSLAVHPVQLYECLLLFVIGYVVWKTRKKWQKNGSAMLFAMCLYFSLRFGVEFFRDHSISQFSTTYYLGVWSIQWIMLGIGILLGISLWSNEKWLKIESPRGRVKSLYAYSEFIYIVAISCCIFLFRHLLLAFELKAVWVVFIPSVILSFHYLLTEIKFRNQRKLVAFLLLTPFYVMAQTIPNQKPEIKRYQRVDIGGSFGDFTNKVGFNPQHTQNQCGSNTSYSYEYFLQTYQIAGAGYSQVIIKGNTKKTFGVNVSGGSIKTTLLGTNQTKSDFVFAINPYAKWESKWFGVGLGLHLGDFNVNKDETTEVSNIEDAHKSYYSRPEIHARVGPKKYLDIDYNYGFMMPSAYPTLYSRSSIGSGFGVSNDYSLRYGRIWNLNTGYISAEALLSDNFGVNLMYIFQENNDDLYGGETSGKFVFSLNYRFGHKIKK
ncbi:prolipoprotein diacylglyceryl transferase [Algibacter mikhailovii]|uniref:prolipoprotein diacylglyceryl transferase n=1 Tax=Algibacter mikhailovii TaxID=425498 RepID=UPI002493EF0E|nr:prolipoprotein diacylglyceryl transferase family protein [Algibacter mikhailovii]